MLSKENNERVTRIGAGTPMGAVMRRYWLPALLSSEIPEPDAPPVRVKLLGENLIAFRDSRGEVGLLGDRCPHRRAPMFFARNEEAGLRCVYHGWKFDTAGNCVDLPSEPPDSPLKQKVNTLAYPTWERNGVIFAYLGPRADIPPYPQYEWLQMPAASFRISKVYEACNWLQALEGGIDTAHSSFAHRNDLQNQTRLRDLDTHPTLEVERTDYGFRYAGVRNVRDKEQYVRAYQFVMPFMQMRSVRVNGKTGEPRAHPTIKGHLWVPMDDESTCVYNFTYSALENMPIKDEDWVREEKVAGRGADDYIPDTFWLLRNGSNDYLVDRQVQRTRTFTGIEGVNTQDFALQEGMGPICDRSEERLGTSDRAIIAARRVLLDAAAAVERGEAPAGVDPETHHVRPADKIIPAGLRWQEALSEEFAVVWR